MSAYCNYTIDQISESGLLPEARVAELKEKLRTLPYEAFTKGGTRIPCVMVAPTTKGESAFLMGHGGALGFMNRHILQTLLTAEELELIENRWSDARHAKREADEISKAQAAGKIIPADEWGDGVFCGDNYYVTVDDFLDDCDNDDEMPKYLYAAKPRKIVDRDILDDILTQLQEDGWEDMTDDDFHGVEELGAAIEAFKKANENVVVYEEDRSTLIDMAGIKLEK
jgi:hypothetical protein